MRILAVLTTVVLLSSFAQADKIVLLDGDVIDGVRIQKETYEVVEYVKSGGRTLSVDTPTIRDIEYSSTSPKYREGMTKLMSGDLLGAAYDLEEASQNERLKDFVRATALVSVAEALLESNNLDDALGFFNDLLVEHPETRHLARALVGKGKTALYKGDHSTAVAAFEQLRRVAEDKSLGDQWPLQADFFTLLTKQAAGRANVQELLDGYEDLRSRASGEYTAIANRSSLQIARIRLDQQELNRALPLFNDIIGARFDTDREVVAGAYNGRGRCLFALAEATRSGGDAEGASAEFGDALLDFLRVHTHYPDVQSTQSEAIYWAAQCFKNIGDDGGPRQAAILEARLKARYPNSSWAGKLR